MNSRGSFLGVLLALALPCVAAVVRPLRADPPATPAPRPPPIADPVEVAKKVLAASRAGDPQALAALAGSVQPPPFLVAGELWALVLVAPDGTARKEAETALSAWAAAWRGRPIAATLPEAVAGWLALGAEERANERALLEQAQRLKEATSAKDADRALKVLQEAAPLLEQAPRSPVAYAVLVQAAVALSTRARTEGLDVLKRAAELAERMGSLHMASRCWAQLGKTHEMLDRLPESLACAEQEVRLCLLTGNRINHASAVHNCAYLLVRLGRGREALARAQELEGLAEALGSWPHRAMAADTKSAAYRLLGDPQASRKAAEEAVAAQLKAGDPARSAEVLFRLAQTLLEQDAWSESHELFLLLRERADLLKDPTLVWLSTGALATLERNLGRPEKALQRSQELVRIAAAYEDAEERPVLLAEATTSVALSRLALGRRGGALPLDEAGLRQGVQSAREALAVYSKYPGLERQAALTRMTLARLLLALGERAEAIGLLEALREAQGSGGDRSSTAALLWEARAHDHLEAGRHVEAADAAREALEVRRHLLRVLAEDDASANRAEAVATAALVVDALARRQRAEPGEATLAASQAFQAAESARGLLLTEGLLHDRAVLWRDLPAELVAEDERTRADVKEARDRWLQTVAVGEGAARGAADAGVQVGASKALATAWKQRDETVLKLQRAARRASAFVDPPAPDLALTNGGLDGYDAIVLYQTVGGEAAHAIVVRRVGARLVDLGPARALETHVNAWLRLLPAAGSGTGEREAAAAVYEHLLRPLEPALKDAKRLLLVPDGVLAFAPLEAALRRPSAGGTEASAREERLVERFDVVYLPSVGVLGALRADPAARTNGRGVLALGDPDLGAAASQFPRLPESRTEAESLVARVPEAERTLLVGAEATSEKLLAALAPPAIRRRVVHLACHGVVNPQVPRATGLLLAGGEVLDVDRLGRERWSADLVTLAACDSGRGRVVPGEGVFGLVRAVLLTGVPRVVTSQWMVEDRATRRLMALFYDGLLGRNLSPARALAEAKRAVLNEGGPGAEPAHWAAFVLWGLPD